MNHEITVVIPTMIQELVNPLLLDLSQGLDLPGKCIIIDNSKGEETLRMVRTPFPLLIAPKPRGNIGVNAAWTLGMDMALSYQNCRAVVILNDDIRITKHFLRKTMTALFNGPTDAGVFSPRVHTEMKHFISEINKEGEKIKPLPIEGRQGCAFSMRRDVIKKIPPIPTELKIFFGDDWIASWLRHYKMLWYVDYDSPAFHSVGVSVKSENTKNTIFAERPIYHKKLKEAGLVDWREGIV